MNKNNFTIGVLGGMGTYATIHVFQQYADIFSAEKEWDRPRIIIDNRCTMPSRVRAYLYGENVDLLVQSMSESIRNLIDSGCNHVILACNTSHLFLPEIYKEIPGADEHVVDIIDMCVSEVVEEKIDKIYLLGTEGTIDSGIYQSSLARFGVKCDTPAKEEYVLLRECIEAVKQNKYTDEVKHTFLELINRYQTCILGCTELPILYEKYKEEVSCEKVFDPVRITLEALKKKYTDC